MSWEWLTLLFLFNLQTCCYWEQVCKLGRILWATLWAIIEIEEVTKSGKTSNNRARCKSLNVPRQAGNEPGSGVWADPRNVPRPHGCAQTLWTSPDLFNGVHTLWEEQAESRGMKIQKDENPEGWKSPPDPATNEKPAHLRQPWMCRSARAALKSSSNAIDILMAFSDTVITLHWTGEEAGRGCGCCWCIHISPLLPETA